MTILCTMPGKFGDLLWALPTVRALAEASGTPVDLQISGAYGSIAPLLREQPYVRSMIVDDTWEVQDTAPMTPRTPPRLVLSGVGHVYQLGYASWPEPTLWQDIANRTSWAFGRALPVDLDRPWITTPTKVLPPTDAPPRVWVAWSEEWFELKVGILVSLAIRFRDRLEFRWIRPWGGRYDEVDRQRTTPGDVGVGAGAWDQSSWLGANVGMVRTDWAGAAAEAQGCGVYVGCLSSQWVLANALGKPVIAVEPNPARHHPVFWRESPLNRLVLGNDGKPTFDGRAVGDALEAWLERWER